MNVLDGTEKEGVSQLLANMAMPVMTMEAFSTAIGLPFSVFHAQCKRGYWPTIKVGKRVLVNVEGVRLQVSRQFLDCYPL